jgi:hypothetical protein
MKSRTHRHPEAERLQQDSRSWDWEGQGGLTGAALENRQGASPREFESPPLRSQFINHIRDLP